MRRPPCCNFGKRETAAFTAAAAAAATTAWAAAAAATTTNAQIFPRRREKNAYTRSGGANFCLLLSSLLGLIGQWSEERREVIGSEMRISKNFVETEKGWKKFERVEEKSVYADNRLELVFE